MCIIVRTTSTKFRTSLNYKVQTYFGVIILFQCKKVFYKNKNTLIK